MSDKEKKPRHRRYREQITPFLWRDTTVGVHEGTVWTYYIKGGVEDDFIRRPQAEISGYAQLKPYLRMPKAKLAETISGPMVVVKEVPESTDAIKMLDSSPQRVVDSLAECLGDVTKMWQQTTQPYSGQKLSRDWVQESLSTLNRMMATPRIQAIADKKLIINGQEFPPLAEALDSCHRTLHNSEGGNVSLCPGDLHLGNLMIAKDGYRLIDPGNYTGANYAPTEVNNLVGGTYLFDLDYEGGFTDREHGFCVDYKVHPRHTESEALLRPHFCNFAREAGEISGRPRLAKDLLFVNEMRVALGWTKRSMDLTNVLNRGMMYVGPAIEHFYSNEIV